MLLALPPNQKGYRMALCFLREAMRSALAASFLALVSAELLVELMAADVSLISNCWTVAPCKAVAEEESK